MSTESGDDAVQFELWDGKTAHREQVWVALGEAVAIAAEWVVKERDAVLEGLVLGSVQGGVRAVIAETPRDWHVLFEAFRHLPSYELWFERDMLRSFDSFSGALDALAELRADLDGHRIEEVGREHRVIAGRPETLRALLAERSP